MHQTGKVMWYHYFFYRQYRYYSNYKNMDEVAPPLYATIIYLAALQMLNFIIIREFVTYCIMGFKYRFADYEGVILPTIFLAANYFFFTHKKRYKKIIKRYEKEPVEGKYKFYIVLNWLYPILSFAFIYYLIFYFW